MKTTRFLLTISSLILLTNCPGDTGDFEPNYDESKVPDYILHDPLIHEDGRMVKDSADWFSQRRPEILELFRHEVYGKVPEFDFYQEYILTDYDSSALNGEAIRKQVTIRITINDNQMDVNLLIYYPKNTEAVPAFLGYNFYGNHTIHPDTGIYITENWVRNNEEIEITDNRANERSRGVRQSRWPVEFIIGNGYAVATSYYGDLDPDFDDGFRNGVHGLVHTGNETPVSDEWGSITAWAWGLSVMLDYLETDPLIDNQKVTVLGHSRLGKTALWAGASDERFAVTISNNSGCGGAALSRRQFGETVERINTVFPHWFCYNFNKYNNNEMDLPVDQHMLIALIAPRPVYIASATEDLWADPRGEFLAAQAADTVYRLLGKPGLSVDTMPEPDHPVQDGYIGYHLRTGAHDITEWDWEQYIKFVDNHLK